MKKVILFGFAFSLLIGCKKSDPPFDSYLSMKIDGVPYHVGFTTKAHNSGNPGRLTISGKSQNVELYIEFTNATTGITPVTGNLYSLRFSLDDFDNQKQYYAGDGGLDPQVGSGQINITELTSDHVKGTFEFVTGPAFDGSKKTVTEGEFNLQNTP